MFKSGYVTIIGRPNVGKSTLLNELMGEKLSIVSNKPQTTRNNINTILTGNDFQIIFIDTPGIHKPKQKLGEYMVKKSMDSLNSVDIIMLLIAGDTILGGGDRFILEKLKDLTTPKFLIINKIDQITPERLAVTIDQYSKAYDFSEIIPISALKGKNTDILLETMVKYIHEGPKYYPDDMITDSNEKFIISEIIREKGLNLLSDEIPHGLAVDIMSMKVNENGNMMIEATLFCERDSHKGIIIGKDGSMLKKITNYSQLDIKKFLNKGCRLKLWVKVKKDWRDSSSVLRGLGYK
ncbi:MAG TPA: GTPase Era [Clostridiaceae bacterium]